MIVLAGGIGSGKSVVARILRQKGWGVYDCDLEARRLMETCGSELKRSLIAIAGEDMYNADGRLDRRRLAAGIFADAGLRKEINEAVHSAVKDDIECWLAADSRNLFVETAISAESGIAQSADEVWMVEASIPTRLERVKRRDARKEEEIGRIMKAQQDEDRRLAALSVPLRRIENEEGQSLLLQIDTLLEDYKERNFKKIY